MIAVVLAGFFLIGLSDFPPLVKEKQWYEVGILSALYAAALAMAVLRVLGVILPSPIKGVEWIISEVLHLSYPVS